MKQFNTPTILIIIIFSIYFLMGCSSPPQQSNYLSPAMRLAHNPPAKEVKDMSPWGDFNRAYLEQVYRQFPDGKPWYGYRPRPNPWMHKYRDDVYWSWNFK